MFGVLVDPGICTTPYAISVPFITSVCGGGKAGEECSSFSKFGTIVCSTE